MSSGVEKDFECLAHGVFTKRTKSGVIPKCPKGCGVAMVKLVFLQPPTIGNVRFKKGDKLLREAAELQGLSDISTSPSRPGGHVMDRIRKKYGGHLQPEQLPRAVDAKTYLGALTHRANEITGDNMRNFTGGHHPGHEYNPTEWKTDEKTGRTVHVGAQTSNYRPPASVERVKEKPQ